MVFLFSGLNLLTESLTLATEKTTFPVLLLHYKTRIMVKLLSPILLFSPFQLVGNELLASNEEQTYIRKNINRVDEIHFHLNRKSKSIKKRSRRVSAVT